jgi:hypothetical protein
VCSATITSHFFASRCVSISGFQHDEIPIILHASASFHFSPFRYLHRCTFILMRMRRKRCNCLLPPVHTHSQVTGLLHLSQPLFHSPAGSVFARDRSAITRISAALRDCAGNFYINDKCTGAMVGQQPFGGARASGTNDKAGSLAFMMRWTSVQSIKESFLPPTSHLYPSNIV